jgi:nucleoid-associated protein YgaU
MATKKRPTKKVNKKIITPKKDVKDSANKIAKDLSSQLKLSESYISLILGAIVVLGISVVFFLFVNGSGLNQASNEIKNPNLPQVSAPVNENTYTLQDGEGLWDVAVKFYGDGFKWIDIAKANGLENNPENVAPGMKLIIPKLQ